MTENETGGQTKTHVCFTSEIREQKRSFQLPWSSKIDGLECSDQAHVLLALTAVDRQLCITYFKKLQAALPLHLVCNYIGQVLIKTR